MFVLFPLMAKIFFSWGTEYKSRVQFQWWLLFIISSPIGQEKLSQMLSDFPYEFQTIENNTPPLFVTQVTSCSPDTHSLALYHSTILAVFFHWLLWSSGICFNKQICGHPTPQISDYVIALWLQWSDNIRKNT
jgi:hypothetical protein